MKQLYTINFQEGDGISRPDDASLTSDSIPPFDGGLLPNVNDFVGFRSGSGPEGVFKVVSRYFEYSIQGESSVVAVNFVVKKQPDSIANLLFKD